MSTSVYSHIERLTPKLQKVARNAAFDSLLSEDDIFQNMVLAILDRLEKKPDFLEPPASGNYTQEKRDNYVVQYAYWTGVKNANRSEMRASQHSFTKAQRSPLLRTDLYEPTADASRLERDASMEFAVDYETSSVESQVEQKQMIEAIFRELDAEEQIIVVMEVKGYKGREIAQELDVTAGRVSQIRSSMQKRIREKIKR